jgi:hypothetical protein
MENNEAQSREDTVKKVYTFVINQMKAGVDKTVICQKLIEMGISEEGALSIVETIHAEVTKTAVKEKFTIGSLSLAIIGGVVAAVIGGGIWGLVVIVTGYVIGLMAWGIGLLAGFAVVLFSRGFNGVQLQVIAALSSVLGIAIGKYITFFYFLKEATTKKYGLEVASGVSFISERVVRVFIEGISSSMSAFDILWVALAVITAWKIPEELGSKV